MKVKQTENSLVNTNATAIKSHKMQVDNEIAMDFMAKLYANPIQTLTQEYLCNGRDAQRAAKSKKPLLVTLPTHNEPTLKIRDYGTGLSQSQVQNIFVHFGKSTKTGTNSQTGGFGIGGKSAFAYTDNFTIVSYVKGTEYVYVAMRCTGGGQLNLISQKETSEPNGVEIQIAVQSGDVEKFVAAVQRATAYWEVKPTFVGNGIDYKNSVLNAGNKVEFCQELPVFRQNTIYVTVDGIPYELDAYKYSDMKELKSFKERLKQQERGYGTDKKELDYHHIIVRCDNGDVEIARTRESLQDSEDTTKGIQKLFAEANAALDAKASEMLQGETEVQGFLAKQEAIRKFFKIEKDEIFLSKSGEKFTINGKGCIVSALPLNLKFIRVTKQDRKKMEIEEVPASEVCLYKAFYTDHKISNNAITIRMKDHMRETSESTAYRKEREGCLIVHASDNYEDKEFLSFVKLLGANNIYDLEVERAPIKSRATDENEVLVNFYCEGYRNYKTRSAKVNLEENTAIHVYALKDGETEDAALQKFWQFNNIATQVGVKFCFIPPSREKKVIGNAKFISLENFFKELPKYISDAHFQTMRVGARRQASHIMRGNLQYLLASKEFIAELPNLKDQETASLFLELSKMENKNQADAFVDGNSGLLEAVAALCPDVNALKLEVDRIYARIEKHYSMLLHMRLYAGDTKAMCSEILWYMNAHFKEGVNT